MNEPYYEDLRPTYGNIQYPFQCHITESKGKSLIVAAHWHYYIEILYMVSGRAKVFLGGECISFSKGDMVLINAREVHSVFGDVDDIVRYIVILFDPQVLYTTARTVFESKYILPFVITNHDHQKFFAAKDISGTLIPDLLNETLQEFNEKKYGFELAIRTNICRVFLWVLRGWQQKGFTMGANRVLKENDIQKFQELFDYLDKNYMYDITAREAAKLCNMSYSYFSRYFKAIIGKTFTEYLNYVRITEAEKLLLTTDLNITQVAVKSGFSNSSYFIQQFKQFKNISPKQFTKKIAKGSD